MDTRECSNCNVCSRLSLTNSSLSEDFAQEASAINQALSLTGSTTAENITKLMKNLSNSILTQYSTNCLPNTVQKETIKSVCTGTNGSPVIIERVNYEQVVKNTTNCISITTSVSSIKAKIEEIITQSATAKVEPLFALGSIILILVIVFILFIQTGVSTIKSIIIILILGIILVSIYLGIAYVFGYYPFNTV